ncbi:hypothetical protein NIES4103_27440 [Nostoc sp. NIES-4103]|nr:hypothetical protein NIES4103_27440 [Nostoc sp. NIES-4103]
MSQCTDVDAALRRLENKINEQNKAIADLRKKQQQCCDGSNSKNLSNTDLRELRLRVAALEKTSEALKLGIVGCLENFADIENTNREITLAFQGIFQIVNPLLDSVSSIMQFLGE